MDDYSLKGSGGSGSEGDPPQGDTPLSVRLRGVVDAV
jgi:hypothetical protein